MSLLINKRARIGVKDDIFYQTPLLRAAINGHEAVVRLLLDKGADTNAVDKDSRTPLF